MLLIGYLLSLDLWLYLADRDFFYGNMDNNSICVDLSLFRPRFETLPMLSAGLTCWQNGCLRVPPLLFRWAQIVPSIRLVFSRQLLLSRGLPRFSALQPSLLLCPSLTAFSSDISFSLFCFSFLILLLWFFESPLGFPFVWSSLMRSTRFSRTLL